MTPDAVVVGSGPNGLAAAITLARAGLRVTVYERGARPGGALASAELTQPGFVHDLGSAVHPLAVASPFFCDLPLHAYGLDWVHPAAPLVHPLNTGTVVFHRDLDETADGLGRDGPAYRRLLRPLVQSWEPLLAEFLQPLLHVPRHPILLARFGLAGLPPASWLARTMFRTEAARALFAGLAAHSTLPLSAPGTSAFGLMLAVAGHAVGWPFPRGGAQALTDAMVGYFKHLGGRIELNSPIDHLSDLPPARAQLFDTSPAALVQTAGDQLPGWYVALLNRYQPGPGAYKVDYALSAPIPWRDPRSALGGTVHLGGTLRELEVAERAPAAGRVPDRPYVLLAQHTLFDPSRAPSGQHTAWAYAHVPNASRESALAQLEDQIERSAPGFRDTILARHISTPAALQAWNPNLRGGDVGGGANTVWQLLARPVPTPTPYRTPLKGLYICSAATPPGGGVHGMGGYWAARAALRDVF